MIHVCSLDDLPTVGAVLADFDGHKVAIARDSGGVVHAIDDACTHGNVSLSEGEVEGSKIECWLHGSTFDLFTGKPTGPPAIKPVAVHTVQIEGNDVYVELNVSGAAPAKSDTDVKTDTKATQGAEHV